MLGTAKLLEAQKTHTKANKLNAFRVIFVIDRTAFPRQIQAFSRTHYNSFVELNIKTRFLQLKMWKIFNYPGGKTLPGRLPVKPFSVITSSPLTMTIRMPIGS